MATLLITLEALQFIEPEELTAAAKRASAEFSTAELRTLTWVLKHGGADAKTVTPASMWYHRTAVELFAERLAVVVPGAVIEQQQNHGLYVSPLKHLGPRGTFSLTFEIALSKEARGAHSPKRIREVLEQEITWILRELAWEYLPHESATTAHARAVVSRWRADQPRGAAEEVLA